MNRAAMASRFAALLVAAAGLSACGGSSSPHVASPGTSSGANGRTGSTSTTIGHVNPTQLLDEWATCMRNHGDPDQRNPTIDAHNVIHLTYPMGYNPKSQGGNGTTNSCDAYLTEASYALGGQPPVQNPSKMLAFSVCMRANGVPDFPDPTNTGGTYHFPIAVRFNDNGAPVASPGTPSDLDPTNPILQSGAKLCAQKVGVPPWGDTPGSAPGSIVDIVASAG
jgi:hypothetical protein